MFLKPGKLVCRRCAKFPMALDRFNAFIRCGPGLPNLGFELVLAGLNPCRVVLFRDPDSLVLEQDAYAFDRCPSFYNSNVTAKV